MTTADYIYAYEATLDRVIDGDTIECTINLGFSILHKLQVRVAGIDTPEVRTKDLAEKERGFAAKARLEELLTKDGGRFVIITEQDKGKYGRYIAGLQSLDGTDIVAQMIAEGHAK